jgi:DnaK suppressor protein
MKQHEHRAETGLKEVGVMATSRKTSIARGKTARPASKTKKSSKPSRSATAGKKSAASPSKGARHKVATKRPEKKLAPAKVAKPAGKASPVKAATATSAKPSGKLVTKIPVKVSAKAVNLKPGAKGAKGKVKLSDAAAKRAAQAEVRPLGVLPPESMVRSVRTAPLPVARPRPASPGPKTSPTTAQGAKRVTEQELKVFEARLLEERRKILKEMGHLETTVLKVNQRDSSGDLSGYSFHMADAGTDAMEREKAFMFASTEGRTLLEINEALRRLYRGEYGVCESCGQPIAHGRLEAMPYAKLCVACKEKEERALRGAQ